MIVTEYLVGTLPVVNDIIMPEDGDQYPVFAKLLLKRKMWVIAEGGCFLDKKIGEWVVYSLPSNIRDEEWEDVTFHSAAYARDFFIVWRKKMVQLAGERGCKTLDQYLREREARIQRIK